MTLHPDQMSLPDPLLDKEYGMAVALSRPEVIGKWADDFHEAIRTLPHGALFTADDVINRIGLPKDSEPNANNSVGALFSGAAKRGYIRKTAQRRLSTRRASHARELVVWERL